MREIVLDTETTGLDPNEGHRIVEIGAVELINHLPTGEVYHQYINPERSMPKEAFDVHGLGDEFLRDQPAFSEIVDAFIGFIGSDTQLVIHNAEFDMRMINAELSRLDRTILPMSRSTDTLHLARKKFPGAQASLDALCRRYHIDNSAREKHGALLDSELLAEVYLELLGGRQRGLSLEVSGSDVVGTSNTGGGRARKRPSPLPSRLTDDERAAHDAFVAEIESPVWMRGGP